MVKFSIPMTCALTLVLGGILLLFWGARQLLNSSVRIALFAGLSPLVIGLTLLSLATSLPEALTSVIAQIEGAVGDVALGNVLGSNIANIGLVLAIGLLITPVAVSQRVKRVEMPLLIVVSLITGALMLKGFFGRWIGICFLLAACGYLVFEWRYGKRGEAISKSDQSINRAFIFFILSLGALTLGAKGLVEGGVRLARELHVAERVIALSVLAVGTSLPELFTVVLAAAKKKDAFVLGNIVGSNILNLFLIIGLAALIRPVIFTRFMLVYDIPMMIGLTTILWVSMFGRKRLSRMFGGIYLLVYIGYIRLIFVK